MVNKKYKKEFAMKQMLKKKIIDKRSEVGILYERDLLSRMTHPFIVNMHFSFQDIDYLYIIMDLMLGGDLRYYYCKHHKFSEKESRFIIACLILALEYIHSNNIIHRDLKPENLVFEENGYLRITDFGIAKYIKDACDKDSSGTPGYMAPEIMLGNEYNCSSDYFGLGIIAYELMLNRRPYFGRNRKEIKEKILASQIQIKRNEVPENWSFEAADFVNKLIQRKPIKRLGYHGIQEIKAHPWFKYYNWKNLYLKKEIAPFIPPQNTDNYDKKFCNNPEIIGLNTKERYEKIVSSEKYKIAFNSYFYFNRYNSNIRGQIESFVNPHDIYNILEEKEKLAFGEQQKIKSRNAKLRKTLSTDGRNLSKNHRNRMLSLNGITNFNTNEPIKLSVNTNENNNDDKLYVKNNVHPIIKSKNNLINNLPYKKVSDLLKPGHHKFKSLNVKYTQEM